MFQKERNEAAPIIKCTKEAFLVQSQQYFEIIGRKNVEERKQAQRTLDLTKKKLLALEKKRMLPHVT